MAMGVGIIAIFLLVCILMGYLFFRQMKLWYIMSKFPGPKAYPIIGNAYQFDTDPRGFFRLLSVWAEKYRTAGASLHWAGPFALIQVMECRNAETILSSSKQLNKGLFYNMLKPWLGSGLLISKGSKWHTRRKLLTPSFHFAILTSFVDIFNEHAQTITSKMTELVHEKSVNIFPMVTRCTLDIICSTAMGKNIGAQQGKNREYVQAVIEMSDIIQERQKYPWLWIDTIYNQLPSGKKHSHNLQILHTLTKTVILLRRAERKRERQQGKKIDVIDDKTEEVRSRRKLAFLDLLLEVHEQDPSFTLEDIREEVDTFMFEGHDTTASGTSWTLFLLGHHPEIQKKVQEELDNVFDNDRDRPVTNDDIQNLTYLNCVVKEALRLFPPVPLIARQLEEDTVLSGNFVPKDTITVIGIYWLHRDPKQFPDPEKFDPDRFLPENIKGRHPFAYVPFSAGPRNCIGQKFALMEEKVILASLLRKLSFKSCQSVEEVSPIGELILRPYKGIEMEISLRA
ncbi:cytochrome P450 4V2-like isoform X6 [Apostichopus japonicus]|uniref:cytochrome P450 4V2-like isoform X6 n=1 Tax=Stichopus japonicus TaxID=307972 RepID=UPI003AB5FF0A